MCQNSCHSCVTAEAAAQHHQQQQQQQQQEGARWSAEQAPVACLQTRFTIDVSYNYRNINLIEKEQQALSAIWNKCCKADVNATTRAIVNEGNGEAAARV